MGKDEPEGEPERLYSHADLAAVEEAVKKAIEKLDLEDDVELGLVSVDEGAEGEIVIILAALGDEAEAE